MLSVDPNFNSIDIPIGAVNLNNGQINIPAARINDFKVGEIYFVVSGGSGAFGVVTTVDKASNRIFWAEGDALRIKSLRQQRTVGSSATSQGKKFSFVKARKHYSILR